jgi:ferredoxin
MGKISFVGMKLVEKVQVDVGHYPDGTLLELARAHGIPLPCDCMEGNCGACAVKVAPLRPETSMIRLSERERYLLLAVGKLSQLQYRADTLPDHPPLWRLACEYRVTDEQIMVAFD